MMSQGRDARRGAPERRPADPRLHEPAAAPRARRAHSETRPAHSRRPQHGGRSAQPWRRRRPCCACAGTWSAGRNDQRCQRAKASTRYSSFSKAALSARTLAEAAGAIACSAGCAEMPAMGRAGRIEGRLSGAVCRRTGPAGSMACSCIRSGDPSFLRIVVMAVFQTHLQRAPSR